MNDAAEAIRIARAIARIASSNDAPAPGSIGTLVGELDALEERIARWREFDQATGGLSE